MANEKKKDKKFKEKVEEIENIIDKLESTDIELEDSMKLYEEGMALIDSCTKKIKESELKVTEIIKKSSGEIEEKEFKQDS